VINKCFFNSTARKKVLGKVSVRSVRKSSTRLIDTEKFPLLQKNKLKKKKEDNQ
jgi:hypothetical protein